MKLAKKNRLDYECFMQNQMGTYIRTKMPLKTEIERLKEELAKIDAEGENKKKSVSID